MASARSQLRMIRRELFELMKSEIDEWVSERIQRLSDEHYQRERYYMVSMKGILSYDKVVDEPNERAWRAFNSDKKLKEAELTQKGYACLAFWKDAFEKFGVPQLRQ